MEPKIYIPHQLILVPNLEIEIRDAKTDKILDIIRTRNLIVKSGRNRIRDMLGWPQLGSVGYTPDYIQLGTNSTVVADSQTALFAPAFSKQITRKIPYDSKILYQLYVESTEANGYGLREAGLNAFSTSGMIARATYNLINKTSSISIVYNWNITLASA